MRHEKLVTYIAAVQDIAYKTEKKHTDQGIPADTALALQLRLLLRHLLYIRHDGGLLLLVELSCLLEGRLQKVADGLAHRHRRVLTTRNEVGLVLLQQEVLNIVHHRVRRSLSHEGIQTAVVVCRLVPSLGSHQVFVSRDASLGGLAVLCGQETLEGLGSLILVSHTLIGQCLVHVEACHLLIRIGRKVVRALLILFEQFSETVNPLQRLLIFLDGQTGIRDVDQSGDGILVGCIAAVLLDILQMLVVGTLETVVSRITRLSETSLTTADIDQQVHVVAGGVALQLLEFGRCGYGALQSSLVVATHGQEVGQSAGTLRKGIHIGILALLRSCLQRSLPIELGHTLLVQSVTGIAQPVVSLLSRQLTRLLQTVCQL